MKWFDNWFARKSKQAWEEAQKQHYAVVPGNSIRAYDGLNSNGLNMTIYKADGGTIVEFRHYDPVKDRNNNTLHVIRDDDDFPQRLSEIITLELMRNGLN